MPTLEELPDDDDLLAQATPTSRSSTTTALPEPSESNLEALLKSLPSRRPPSLTPAEVDLLFGSFPADVDPRVRSLAFLVLAQLSASLPADSTTIEKVLAPRIEDVLIGTDLRSIEQALALLAALCQTMPAAALAILVRPGLQDNLFDLLDLYPPSSTRALPIALALTDLVSQVCNSAQGRTVLLSGECDWKESLAQQSASTTLDPALRAAATVALAKLSRGTAEGAEATMTGTPADPAAGEQEALLGKSDERLALVLKGIVEASAVPSASSQPKAVIDAVEGLALTSYRPRIKELLSVSKPFLAKLFAIVPPPPKARSFNEPAPTTPLIKATTASTVQYGVATIIANLVAYRPLLSAEQSQIDRLRKMTLAKQSKSGPPVEDDPLDDDRAVARRVKRLLDAGAVPVLIALGRSESRIVRETVGKAYLALVHDQAERATVVKAGGAKALLVLCASLLGLPSPATSFSSTADAPPPPSLEATVPALQALAKLLITTSPFAIFGPAASSSAADAVRPLAALLGHPSSSLLQRFEALMALTNLASIDPTMADRIATFDSGAVARQMEELMLDDNTLVRRAATELLCNLLASEPVFLAWSGEPPSPSSAPTPAHTRAAEQKLHILVALCTVPDLPTQLAASGALATVASSPIACRLMLVRKEGPARPVQSILELLLPSTDGGDDDEVPRPRLPQPMTVADPGLVHRAAVVLCGVLDANSGDAAVSQAFASAGARAIIDDALEDIEVGMASSAGQGRGSAGGMRDEIAAVLREVRDRLPPAAAPAASTAFIGS